LYVLRADTLADIHAQLTERRHAGLLHASYSSSKPTRQFIWSVREREHQREGIAKAKNEAKYKGRPASIDAAEIKPLTATMGPAAIAKHLGIARGTVDRLRAANADMEVAA
jgi:hypothetical protein